MSGPAFSRRLFLGGLVGFAAAPEIIKTRTEVPTIWGDMIHDDAPGLNALFRGDPVHVMSGQALIGEQPALIGAKCLIRSNIVLNSARILGCTIVSDECSIVCGEGAWIENNFFVSEEWWNTGRSSRPGGLRINFVGSSA